MTQIPQHILNQYAQDSAYPQEHMDAIIEAARWADPQVILDVGTFHGSSALHFQYAFPDALVITVGDTLARGWISADFTEARRRFAEWGMDRIVLIESDTRYCGPQLAAVMRDAGIVGIGFAFLDACHDYDGLMLEYKQYEPFLAAKHVLVADDTTEVGVKAFSHEMVGRGYVYEQGPTLKGLAILKWG